MHLNSSTDILDNYGGLNCNSLVAILQPDSDINDDEPNILEHSWYFDIDAMINTLDGKSGFKILSLNCQSLNAKINQLRMYISIFLEKNLIFDAICLQESWLSGNEITSDLSIPNYTLLSQGKSCSAHGGLATYLHEKYQYTVAPNSGNAETNWEYQIVDIMLDNPHNKNLRIGNIYRLPRETNADYDKFFNEFFEMLQNFGNNSIDMVLCGDFNINLLQLNEKPKVSEFFENMLSDGYIPKVTLPTRLSSSSATLIDNFFCKLSVNFSKTTTGILTSQISDHKPYFICLDYLCSKSSPLKYVKVQNFSESKLQEFKDEFASLHINEKFSDPSNLNDNFEMLHSEIVRLRSKYFPVKFLKFHKHKHKKNAWMTNGLLKSIRYRDKLYVSFKKCQINTPQYFTLKSNLSTYNKILKATIREAKQLHYHSLFKKYKHDIKKTWNVIRNIMDNDRYSNNQTTSFSIDGAEISNPQVVANKFNEYFCSIGPTLASNISCPSGVNFNDYLAEPVPDNFQFVPVNADIIDKTIMQIAPKTSCGLDGISMKFLRSIKDVLTLPLATLINQIFDTGIFPDRMKSAKIIPIYKKDDVSKIENYRPISLLSSFSKIVEKVMLVQLDQHFLRPVLQ